MIRPGRLHQVTAQFSSRRRANASGAGVEQAQSQKRKQRQHIGFGQRRGTAHEIVFMTAKVAPE